jgi:hypothetical protein
LPFCRCRYFSKSRICRFVVAVILKKSGDDPNLYLSPIKVVAVFFKKKTGKREKQEIEKNGKEGKTGKKAGKRKTVNFSKNLYIS